MKKKYTLGKKLASYSTFATAFLATAKVADAQILYTDVNPDDTITAPGVYLLDLNNDGMNDYQFNVIETANGYGNNVRVIGYGDNLASRDGDYGTHTWQMYYYAYILSNGDVIGNYNSFTHQLILASHYPYYSFGNWIGASDQYLGLKLSVNSNTYYGWVRLSVSPFADQLIVSEYAVDTIANEPSIAGDKCGNYSFYANTIINGPSSITLCEGNSADLTTDFFQDFTYQWYNGNTLISGATNSIYTTGSSGIYDVVATNSYGCVDTSSEVDVTVFSLPDAPIITQDGDTMMTTSAASYQWYLDNVAIPGATNQTYYTTIEGIYTVQITDANGCTSISDPYTFIPEGISNAESKDILVIEADNFITVQLNTEWFLGGHLKIFSEDGREVYSELITAESLKIDMNGIASGIYLLSIDKSGVKAVRKVMIR